MTLVVAISRGLNGVGLAIVIPAIQSLVADSTDDNNCGTTFGWLQLTGNLGSINRWSFFLLIASTSVIGIDGWRIAFHLVGLISVIVGILVRLFANDPHYVQNNGKAKDEMPHTFSEEVKDLIKESKLVIKIPTFQILIAQGVFGSFPLSVLWTIFIIDASLGSLFGGKMGDVLAKPFPNAGRIVLSQISAGSAIPFAALLLLGLPDDPSTGFIKHGHKVPCLGFMHGLVLFIMG
ncbi:putative major facilitator superfamily [Rosa chinensis]|uniref:Putative major facilitator superfamily n=1 Tax=Rosa chinensis TaxID=74649 RepID=A0A2P6RQT9_ROSCH|nr:putative major facilitator superfamily [Rosa chinensis]